MKNKLINIVLVLLCLAVGFAVGMQVFGPKDRTYTVKNGDSFYAQPSVTAAVCTDSFVLGQQLEVIGRVEFTKPTAVKLKKELLLDGADKLKYKLHQGGVYKVAEARLDKANTPCVLEVETLQGEKAKLEADKSALLPVDEGRWLNVRSPKTKAEGWVRVESKWY